MTNHHIISCDESNCKEEIELQPVQIGRVMNFHRLILGDGNYPNTFDFCSIACLAKFIALKEE